MLRTEALNALSAIAFVSKEHFQKYNEIVIPHLKTILLNENDKSNHTLLRYALECISIVALIVDKEKFEDDLKQVMEMLKFILESEVKELDTIVYGLQACERICANMKKDFLPYMSIVMPYLFECAQLEPDKTMSSYELDESIQKVKIGDAIICVRGRDLLIAKSRACTMLGAFALELGEDFYPWVAQAASILVPLLKYYIHDGVRKIACDVYYLLHSAKLAVEEGTAQAKNRSYFKQLSGDIILALGNALHSVAFNTLLFVFFI